MPLAIVAITGAAPPPVHHPVPQVMKTMSVSLSISLISCSCSSAAFLPISIFAHVQKPMKLMERLSPIFIFLSANFIARFCVSVPIATKSTPSNHSDIILSTKLHQPCQTPMTLILTPGTNSSILYFVIK